MAELAGADAAVVEAGVDARELGFETWASLVEALRRLEVVLESGEVVGGVGDLGVSGLGVSPSASGAMSL